MDSNSQSDMTNLNRHYEALTPKNNIENGQEYMAAFDWALSKSNIHNIAISVLIMRSMDVKDVGQNTLMRTLIHY